MKCTKSDEAKESGMEYVPTDVLPCSASVFRTGCS